MSYSDMSVEDILKDLAEKVEANRIGAGIDERHWDGLSSATYTRFKKSGVTSLEKFVSMMVQLGRVSELEELLNNSANNSEKSMMLSRKRVSSKTRR